MGSATVTFVKSASRLAECPDLDVPEVALAGKSNVGKSSLINKLLGRKALARVSQTPGRTRLLNFFRIDGAQPLALVDLPGYGYAKVSKGEQRTWMRMMGEYLGGRENLAGVVVIVDVRRGVQDEDQKLLTWLDENERPAIVVATKVDKLPKNRRGALIRKLGDELELEQDQRPVAFSARSGEGQGELWKRLASLVRAAEACR